MLEDVDCHVEVVVLHGGGGVDGGQGGPNVDHELVVEAPVVQVMAEGPDEHGEGLHHISTVHPLPQTHLQWSEDVWVGLQHGVGAVGHVEAVTPVVVGHVTVVLTHCHGELGLKVRGLDRKETSQRNSLTRVAGSNLSFPKRSLNMVTTFSILP